MDTSVCKNIYSLRIARPLGADHTHDKFINYKFIRDELKRQSTDGVNFLLYTPSYLCQQYIAVTLQEISKIHQTLWGFKVSSIFLSKVNINMQCTGC